MCYLASMLSLAEFMLGCVRLSYYCLSHTRDCGSSGAKLATGQHGRKMASWMQVEATAMQVLRQTREPLRTPLRCVASPLSFGHSRSVNRSSCSPHLLAGGQHMHNSLGRSKASFCLAVDNREYLQIIYAVPEATVIPALG